MLTRFDHDRAKVKRCLSCPRFRTLPSENMTAALEIFRGSRELYNSELQAAKDLDKLYRLATTRKHDKHEYIWLLDSLVRHIIDLQKHRRPPATRNAYYLPNEYYYPIEEQRLDTAKKVTATLEAKVTANRMRRAARHRSTTTRKRAPSPARTVYRRKSPAPQDVSPEFTVHHKPTAQVNPTSRIVVTDNYETIQSLPNGLDIPPSNHSHASTFTFTSNHPDSPASPPPHEQGPRRTFQLS